MAQREDLEAVTTSLYPLVILRTSNSLAWINLKSIAGGNILRIRLRGRYSSSRFESDLGFPQITPYITPSNDIVNQYNYKFQNKKPHLTTFISIVLYKVQRATIGYVINPEQSVGNHLKSAVTETEIFKMKVKLKNAVY